jgi:hypothetical protein
MLSVSFQIDLPLNLKISLSVKFDIKTGKLTINASIGFGSGSIINGSQPIPLQSENAIIAGGIERSVNPSIVVRTEIHNYEESTIYDTFQELVGYTPQVLNSNNVPYELVSREFNNLDFATTPSDALTSFLIKSGVSKADQVIRYLLPLIQYGSVFDFLKVAAVLADPYEQLIITTGLGDLGAFKDEVVTQISPAITPQLTDLITVVKPATIQCPSLPVETYTVFRRVQRGEPQAASKFIESYFGEEAPDFQTWVEDLDLFLAWTNERHHPFYPALVQLSNGNVLNFSVLLVYLTVGIDLRAYPSAYSELQAYLQISFSPPTLGVSE